MIDKLVPIDKEITVKADASIMVKTDNKGIIEYANEYFIELSGYEIGEIIGKDISLVKHPEMPDIIFDLIWESLLKKENTKAIIKNISKTGEYFWLQAKFDFKVNENTREIENFYAYYSPVSKDSITKLNKLYQVISKIEKRAGMDIAESYFLGYLEDKSQDYNEFVEEHFQY